MRQVARCRGGRINGCAATSRIVTSFFFASGWSEARDQHRLGREHVAIVHSFAFLGHRSDGEIDLIGPQHGHAITARDVVQFQFDRRIAFGEFLDERRQQIQQR